MYYKIIGGRQVFSACKTIQTNEGAWVSNPSEEQILDAGWLPYVPPEVIPEPQEEPGFGEVIEAVKRMLSSSAEELSDEEALEVAALFPTWVSKLPEDPLNPKPEDTLTVGYKVWYDTKLYKVLQPHVPQENWTPDKSPSLYTRVSIEEWPEWVQPTGAHDAYMTGDKRTHNGKRWESEIDYNVYEPGVYGWKEV